MLGLLNREQRAKIQHVACDFLESGEKIAEALKAANVTASHVFFYSYLQPKPPAGQPIWSNADELVKVNSALLSNFLEALPAAGIKPKRFLLQTGAKNYGKTHPPHLHARADLSDRCSSWSRAYALLRIGSTVGTVEI